MIFPMKFNMITMYKALFFVLAIGATFDSAIAATTYESKTGRNILGEGCDAAPNGITDLETCASDDDCQSQCNANDECLGYVDMSAKGWGYMLKNYVGPDCFDSQFPTFVLRTKLDEGALSPIGCKTFSDTFLQVAAGSNQCSAVAVELNKVNISGVTCDKYGRFYMDTGTQCRAARDALNTFDGIAGVDCYEYEVMGAPAPPDYLYIPKEFGGETQCLKVAAKMNSMLDPEGACDRVGTYQTNGTCKCDDPTDKGPFCEFSDVKTCAGAGVAQADGSCVCTDPADGVGPFCEFSNAKTCSDEGVAQADGSCVFGALSPIGCGCLKHPNCWRRGEECFDPNSNDCYDPKQSSGYLEVAAGSDQCASVVAEWNKVQNISSLKCNNDGKLASSDFFDFAMNNWRDTCDAVFLNSFDGIAGTECEDYSTYIGDGNYHYYHRLYIPVANGGQTQCRAVAATMNQMLTYLMTPEGKCNRVGTYQTDGTCDCTDPNDTGPVCEFSNSKTCNDAGVAQADGSCVCNDPAVDVGPSCAPFAVQALSPIGCSGSLLQVEEECAAVAAELNKVDGIMRFDGDGVECYDPRTLELHEQPGFLTVKQFCGTAQDTLNRFDGIAGVDFNCDARQQSWQAHGRLTTPSDSKCKILAAKMNEMLVTAAGCSASGGALQTDGTCGCKKGYFRGELYNSTAANFTLSTYTTLCTACPPYTFQDQDLSNVTKCSNASVTTCSDAGDPNPTTGMCDCDPGIQGKICDSENEELATADAKKLVPFYGAAGAISVVTLFGSASYAYCYLDESKTHKLKILLFALLVTLRIFDTMSDWAMYALTLRSKRFTEYSTYSHSNEDGADGLGLGLNTDHLQYVSLAFTIIGTLLLTLDLATFKKRAASWFSSSEPLKKEDRTNIGMGMAAILLFEDVPQLAIAIAYLKSVGFGFKSLKFGVDANDVFALGSLVLSILSLLANGVQAAQNFLL